MTTQPRAERSHHERPSRRSRLALRRRRTQPSPVHRHGAAWRRATHLERDRRERRRGPRRMRSDSARGLPPCLHRSRAGQRLTPAYAHDGRGLHSSLSGRWALPYSSSADGEVKEIVLERWDVCSVPPGVWRGFRNAGSEKAELMVIVGGTDAGRLEWAPSVIEAASGVGKELDAHGYMPD